MDERNRRKPTLNGSKHPSPFAKASNVGYSPDPVASDLHHRQQLHQQIGALKKTQSEKLEANQNHNRADDPGYFTKGVVNNFMMLNGACLPESSSANRFSEDSSIPVGLEHRVQSPVEVPRMAKVSPMNFANQQQTAAQQVLPTGGQAQRNTRQLFMKTAAAPISTNLQRKVIPGIQSSNEQSPDEQRNPSQTRLNSQGPPDQQMRITINNHSLVTSPVTKTGQKSSVHQSDRIDLLQPRIISSGTNNVQATKKQQVVPQRANTLTAKLKMAKSGQAVFSNNNSTKECTFCQPSLPHTTHVQHSSCMMNSNSSLVKPRPPVPTKNLIMENLGRKYGNCHIEFENLKVVNDLIYNEQTHMVSIFKDYLILDDINEFLKRFYNGQQESHVRLPKLCEFYEKYSHVFPNFVSLPESKYMFRNIQRKQKLIDDQFNRAKKQNGEDEGTNESQKTAKISLLHSSNKLFTTGFIDSVWNQNICSALPEEDWTARRREAQEKRYLASARRLDKKDRREPKSMVSFHPDNMDALVQKFLSKDTESTIRMNSSLGQIGDDILGSTFRGDDLSYRRSSMTIDQQDVASMKGEIGLIHRRSDISEKQQMQLSHQQANRMSVITAGSNINDAKLQCQLLDNQQHHHRQPQQQSPTAKALAQAALNTQTLKNQQQNVNAGGSFKSQGSFGTVLQSSNRYTAQKMSGKKSKKSSSGASQRKSSGTAMTKTLSQQQMGPKSTIVLGYQGEKVSLKQKVLAQGSAAHVQNQLGSKYLTRQQQSMAIMSAPSQQQQPQSENVNKQSQNRNSNLKKSVKSQQAFHDDGLAVVEEQKFLRDNYLECDIIGQISGTKIGKKRQSGTLESNSQSPVEGIMNPLSAQPLLSKTSMNQKTTQPGSSLAFFQQRSSELCLGSATPTQHLYHSKQTSFKNSIVNNNKKVLPQLNLIQQQVESDYYSSGKALQQNSQQQFIRSQTALNSIQNYQPSLTLVTSTTPNQNAHHNLTIKTSSMTTKHVSRERSPPLMQTTKNLKKISKVKSPHQKKDKRAAAPKTTSTLSLNQKDEVQTSQYGQQYQTGKNSVSSAKNNNRNNGTIQSRIQSIVGTKTTTGNATTSVAVKYPSTFSDLNKPISTKGSIETQPRRQTQASKPKLYSSTEINEREEDYPDEEIADEIPDEEADTTEDEQDHHLVSDVDIDEESRVNNESVTSSVRERLRPVDMLLTHGGAFNNQDEDDDTYKLQLVTTGSNNHNQARAQTQLAYHAVTKMSSNAGGLRQTSSTRPGQKLYGAGTSHQSVQQPDRQSLQAQSVLNYGSAQQNEASITHISKGQTALNFNSTQQPQNLAAGRLGLRTELGMQTVGDSEFHASQNQLQSTLQMPLTASHAANRPNTNLIWKKSSHIHSKFSRENSISSRQETQPAPAQKPSQPIIVTQHNSQRLLEATMKLGGKALQNNITNNIQQQQNQTSLTASLRQSLELSQKTKANQQSLVADSRQYRQKPPQTSQASINQSKPKVKQSSNSLPKSQHQKQQIHFKVDLTTRLANNLISEQLSKHKGQQISQNSRIITQKSGAKTANLPSHVSAAQVQAQMQQAFAKSGSKPGSFAKQSESVISKRILSSNRQGGGAATSIQTSSMQSTSHWKRKNVTSQSPPAASVISKQKKASVETLGFKAMGSGKASYLTNVGIAATQNTLSASSRNLTSPYATANQFQRLTTTKDASCGSLPKTKVLSRSPPISSKDSTMAAGMMAQTGNQQKSQNFTLQQQLSQINRQLAMNQVKTGSFRQSNAISPSLQSQGSQKKTSFKSSLVGLNVMSPGGNSSQTAGSLINTGEKGKMRKSLDGGQNSLIEIKETKSLQRQSQQLNQLAATQALISLPGGKNQQKNLQIQVSRATGSKQSSKQRLAATIELNKNLPSTTTQKASYKANNFLGQPRHSNQSKMSALSPMPQTVLKSQQNKQKKMTGPSAEHKTSDRSLKFSNRVITSNNQASSFQKSQGELSKGIQSVDFVPTRFSEGHSNNQQNLKKQNIMGSRQLKK